MNKRHPSDSTGRAQSMPSGQEPLVSVVTPAYNEERYIEECIESVLSQTYPHWEHTIVDNCSTDGTLRIARRYAERDPRVRVVTNDSFVPVVANYNIAFRQVSGESKYCKLVAADDWIYPDCLEKMVRLAEAHPSVAIVGAYKFVGTKLDTSGLVFPTTVTSGREVCRNYLSKGPYLFGAPTPFLFRADIVRSRHAFFNEEHLHSDTEACLEFLEHSDFGFVHQVLTFIRKREESLSAQSRSKNAYISNMLELLLAFGSKYFDDAELECRIRDHMVTYYNFLGSEVGRGRGQEFWSFHRKRLAELNHPMSHARVLVNAVLYAIEASARRLRRKV